jgi:hypothetical protein
MEAIARGGAADLFLSLLIERARNNVIEGIQED